MLIHYITSEHKEGTRYVALGDARSVKFEVLETRGVPCEGAACPICHGLDKMPNATVEAYDSEKVPKELETATVATSKNGNTVTIKTKKVG